MKAVVSGASKGLGKAISVALAKEGYHLVLMSRTKSDLEKVKEEIESDVEVETVAIDLSKKDDINKLKIELEGEDKVILVNNVGTFSMEDVTELDRETIGKMMEINLYGSLELTNKLLPQLRKANEAHIFNISSINGLAANPEAPAYSISKHGMKAWSDALREKLRKEQIKLTAFYPGPINTSSWEGADVNHSAMIQAEDIASMIVQISKLSKGALVEEVKLTPLDFNP